MISREEALRLFDGADLIFDESETRAAVERIGQDVTARLADTFPLVLQVMRGASVFCGQLLPLLKFPLELDYIHATRYGGSTRGASIQWFVAPREDVKGRTILVLDDILDAGITLTAIRDALLSKGALAVHIAVLCEKDLVREVPVKADFVGLRVPNRYVFGFGMDVHGAWRNLPAIYALNTQEHGQ
ncbi:MAG: hypoxanthine-guanine phosphoribosyltransferase [Betaproteobacteria bacterium]|nr:hypoxanthine-guanine phosphoribosyltransferase [Betaproteobacteria bacterium]